jgi:hypothetical protein
MNDGDAIRRALLLIVAGLSAALVCVLKVTPATFVLFAALGLPLVGFGVLIFLRVVWRSLRDRDGD